MQIVKPRYELTNARLFKGWTEAEVAARLNPNPSGETVRRWELGVQTPRADMIGELCRLFGVKHPRELNLDAQFNASTQYREDEIIAMLEKYDRRQLLDVLSRLSMFAGIDLTALFSTTLIAPEKLLNVCRVVIKKCWNLLDENGNDISGVLLSACLPELESLATHSSPYQYDAALLAVEATIMQMIIAIRKLDFVRLVELGEDAVRFGKISGDNRLLVTAMRWHGDTYKNYYHQPKTAISIYNDALKCGDISLLNKADIYIGLAVACAQDDTQEDYETEAREYAELTQMTMPEYPEQDPLFRFIRTGQSEIDQRVGKVYLVLARHFPTKKEYAQMAYDAYEKATSKQSLSISYRCQALISKADAALGIGKMYSYLDCLEEGVPIARQTDNQQRLIEAVTILQKAPQGWRNEQRYIELRKDLTPQSGIVRSYHSSTH